MRLARLTVRGFRNLADTALQFPECVSGRLRDFIRSGRDGIPRE